MIDTPIHDELQTILDIDTGLVTRGAVPSSDAAHVDRPAPTPARHQRT